MKQCSIEGCENGSRAKGMCSAHYQQQRRNDNVSTTPRVVINNNDNNVVDNNDTKVRKLFDKTLELAKRVQELEAITERFSKPFEQACIDGTLLSYLAEAKLAGSRNASVINQQIKADAANEARNKEIDQITDPIDPITDEECEAMGLDELMSGEEA